VVMIDVDYSFNNSLLWRVSIILVELDVGEGLLESMEFKVGDSVRNWTLDYKNVSILMQVVPSIWSNCSSFSLLIFSEGLEERRYGFYPRGVHSRECK
jgi:hypothetical protein